MPNYRNEGVKIVCLGAKFWKSSIENSKSRVGSTEANGVS